MGVYGPFNASLNTVVQVTGIDVNADRVFVDNQSKYTLAIGFTPTQPTAIATLYGHPWYGEVPPGGKTVPIPRSAYNEQFPGYFWVLALDPLTATRAYSGGSSLNTAFFVQALVAGEASPPDYAIPQSTDLSSQPRIMNLPAGPGGTFTASLAGGITATGAANGYYFGNLATAAGGGGPAWPGTVGFYCYYVFVQVVHTVAIDTVFIFSLAQRDASHNLLAHADFLVFRLAALAAATNVTETYNPQIGPGPLEFTSIPVANAAEMGVLLYILTGTLSQAFVANAGATVDNFTGTHVQPVGLGGVVPGQSPL